MKTVRLPFAFVALVSTGFCAGCGAGSLASESAEGERLRSGPTESLDDSDDPHGEASDPGNIGDTGASPGAFGSGGAGETGGVGETGGIGETGGVGETGGIGEPGGVGETGGIGESGQDAAAGQPAEAPPETPPPAEAPPPEEPAPVPPPGRPAADPHFQRRLPDTNDRIHVFYDQLHNHLSDAQYAFVARHADGSQKLTRNVSERIRAVNPDFVVLQYRLAFGLSAEHNITDENTWSRDTIEPDDVALAGDPRQTREDFYLHVPAGSDTRVQHEDNYWLADVRNEAWQTYHIDELMRRMPQNAFDGVFLDTAHVRWDGLSPDTWWSDFCGPEYHALPTCWDAPARHYYETMVARFRQTDTWFYAVGNFGPLITEADRNDYLAPLDGGMIEHFMFLGGYPVERDWHITAERITRLLGDTKILIAEPLHFDLGDRRARRWLIGNFLFFKGHQSFAAFYPNGTGHVDAPVWLPEYDLDLGAPLEPVPANAGERCTSESAALSCGGLYVRDFSRGYAVVNPAGAERTLDLPPPPAGQRYALVDFEGGGYVDASGVPAAQRLVYTPVEGVRITVPGQDARLVVRIGPDGAPAP